jgi:ABC-type branched-subunit amino acid transport system substrate-binding protein
VEPGGQGVGSGGAVTPVAPSRPGAPAPMTDVRAGSPVEVGFVVCPSCADALGSVGGNGSQNAGSEETNYRLLVKELNARGGLAGHPVRPVFYDMDPYTAQPQMEQRYCSAFTEDAHVVAVVSTNGAGETLRACSKAAGALLIAPYLSNSDGDTYRRYPGFFEMNGLGLDRVAANLASQLESSGYFTTTGAAKPTVGVLSVDLPTFRRAVEKVLKPRLARLGHPVVAVAYTQYWADHPGDASAVSSSVLRFRQSGVDHLILLSSDGSSALFFLNAASAQQYFPRYAFTSQDVVQALLDGGFLQNPKSTLAGALGVGWLPEFDVHAGSRALRRASSAACLQGLKKTGQQYASSAARFHAEGECDGVRFLELAAKSGGGATYAALIAGARSLVGTRLSSAQSFGTALRPGRGDGAAVVRPFAFDAACTCFDYSGPESSAS